VRLPGKALLEIAGKPMICWVVERALAARNVNRAIVPTDDERILEAVKLLENEIVVGLRAGNDRNPIGMQWKAGRLFQILYAGRATNHSN
jgi:CMP-2-keto-3-deoxyoctulosonic acid synthetase